MKIIFYIIVLTFTASAYSDTVSGTLKFDRRAPFTGLVFVEQTEVPPVSVRLDQKDKMFSEKLVTVTPSSTIRFSNSDDFDHNIFANDLVSKVQFDVGLIPGNSSSEMSVDWQEGTLVRIGCKIHPRMRAYIANIQSRHFEVIEFAKGQQEASFSLANIPAENETIKVLLPGYDDLVASLGRGGSTSLDVTRRDRVVGQLRLQRSP